MAHHREEIRLRPIGGFGALAFGLVGRCQLAHLCLAVAQRPFLLLQPGDIGADADDAAVARPPFVDQKPAAVRDLMFEGAIGIAMAGEPFGDPLFDAAGGLGDVAGFGAGADDLLEGDAGPDQGSEFHVHRPVLLVAQDQAVLRIEQGEALAHAFDAVAQELLGLARALLGPALRELLQLQVGDIDAGGDRIAVVCLPLRDEQAAPVVQRKFDIGVQGPVVAHLPRHPRRRRGTFEIEDTAFRADMQNVFQSAAGNHDIGEIGVDVGDALVHQDQAAAAIDDRQSLAQGIDGAMQAGGGRAQLGQQHREQEDRTGERELAELRCLQVFEQDGRVRTDPAIVEYGSGSADGHQQIDQSRAAAAEAERRPNHARPHGHEGDAAKQ